MQTYPATLERDFFRALNTIVEPAVRRGVGSSRLTPASLIVLESIGHKSGKRRRTPLWSWRMAGYRVVSTARGTRSLWVKNLKEQPLIRYYIGGKSRGARAIVLAPDFTDQPSESSPLLLHLLLKALRQLSPKGWSFAVLVPSDH